MANVSFQLTNSTFSTDSSKKIISIQVQLVANDFTGNINVTDIMLQRGEISTEWSGHPAEIKWTTSE